MTSDPYPDRIPEGLAPMTKFTFDIGQAKGAKLEIDNNLEKLRDRLDKLIDRFQVTINGQKVPLIDRILALTHDPAELKGLALGLDRISTFIKSLDALENRSKVIGLIEEDPNWLTVTFADFETDIEAGLKQFEDLTLEQDEHP